MLSAASTKTLALLVLPIPGTVIVAEPVLGTPEARVVKEKPPLVVNKIFTV